MRTRTDYACECGHTGYSILSENDQPYSKMWERLDAVGFSETELAKPVAQIRCPECGQIGKVRSVGR